MYSEIIQEEIRDSEGEEHARGIHGGQQEERRRSREDLSRIIQCSETTSLLHRVNAKSNEHNQSEEIRKGIRFDAERKQERNCSKFSKCME